MKNKNELIEELQQVIEKHGGVCNEWIIRANVDSGVYTIRITMKLPPEKP